MGPNGSENFKTLLLLQITAKRFQTFPEISSQWSSQNFFGTFEILKIEILRNFFSKISNLPLYRMEKEKKTQLCGKRAIVQQNGGKFVTRE